MHGALLAGKCSGRFGTFAKAPPAARKNVRRAFAAGPAITRTIVRKTTCQQLGLGVRDSGFGDRVLAFGLVALVFLGSWLASSNLFAKKMAAPQ